MVQKHRASRLHYDFRLEAGGVLASWAVPKGPSLDPAQRRLAMHVEDHPLDYREFEGVIPPKQYGAGSVIVWDEGTYELAEGSDPAREIASGKIKFVMNGHRLKGMFSLVKIKPHGDESGEPWLLIKDRDEYADVDRDITAEDTSTKTGRTLDEVAANPKSARWQSKPKKAAAKPARAAAKRDPLPRISSPMLATLADAPFDGDEWLFEIKWDGYRALCVVDESGKLTLTSRNGNDLLAQFPAMGDLASAFVSVPIVVDGEVVALDEKGRSSFQRLQEHARDPAVLHFVAFDLLYTDGRDVRGKSLEERKALLQRAIADDDLVLYSKHVVGDGVRLFEGARDLQLEGIVAKRRTSTYQMRRSRDWLKIKAQNEQEFVVGGWTDPRGSRKGFGALLLGVREGKALHYVGSVGTGFDAKLLRSISAQLKTLATARSPFDGEVDANAPTHWAKPELVAQVRFAEWTRDEHLRQPAFLGLRTDKDPDDVVAEHPATNDAYSNLDKVLWPRDGYTKGDLIAYYQRVARWLLPYLKSRPLTLERYPNGIDAQSFYAKRIPQGYPDWAGRATIERSHDEDEAITYVVCDDERTLAYLANLAAIVLHPWISRVDAIDEPNYVLFDLDPGEACTLRTLARVALGVRDTLGEIGLHPLIKTSGATGLHAILPLAAGYSYESAKTFAEAVAHRVADTMGDAVTLVRAIAKRPQETVYFDYQQVGRGKTLVPPYVVRPRDGAPVSVPLKWADIEAYARSRVAQPWKAFEKFTIANVPQRLERDGDLWAGKAWKPARLERAVTLARKRWA